MQWWQILATSLGYDPELVVGDRLEQRFSQQAEPFNLLWWSATILSLVVGTECVHCLLDQRLAGLTIPTKVRLSITMPRLVSLRILASFVKFG